MQKSLIREIETIREALINTALEKGLSAQETLTLSRNLDDLLNQVKVCARGPEIS